MRKKIFWTVMASVCLSLNVPAQSSGIPTKEDASAVERIIVEKYHVATEADSKDTSTGHLAKGSVTYRIYVDLKPGYHLQAVYGVPGHPMFLKTSTQFYNDNSGGFSGDQIWDERLGQGNIALDSWVTIGVASRQRFGVPLADDPDSSIIRKNGFEKADGLMRAGNVQKLLYYGTDLSVFGNDQHASMFDTQNASWGVVGGGKGPTKDNKILIAQLTTNGKLTFELNLQVGTPAGGAVQFVAKDPVKNEVRLKQLTRK